MKLKILPFASKSRPYRVMVPAKTSPTGKRMALYFKTQEDAAKKIKDIKVRGTLALVDIEDVKTNAAVANDSRHWQYLKDAFGLSEAQVTAALQREVAVSKLTPITVEDAILAYQAHRTELVKRGEKKASTVDSDRWRLLKLANEFEGKQLVDLDEFMLREFFAKLPGNNGRSIYKSINPFLEWARTKQYLTVNPLAAIKATSTGEFGINNEYYPIETFRRMLRIAAGIEVPKKGSQPTKEFIDLLPWFVLSGFGGLRSCEAFRLTRNADSIRWTDLYFETEAPKLPNIEIRDTVAKRTKRKGGDQHHVDFEPAIAAIQDWLSLCPRYDSPWIVRFTKRHLADLKREFTKATGIKFLKNGLRNSFATYASAYSGESGLGLVARNMGDLETTVKRHYHQSIPTGTGQVWFNLRPFETVRIAAAK